MERVAELVDAPETGVRVPVAPAKVAEMTREG